MNLGTPTSWATIVATMVALATLARSVNEYRLQGTIKRADKFLELRMRLKSSNSFQRLLHLTESDSPDLKDVPYPEKRDLLGFFEEVALMMNSKLISQPVAWYMFGYYAVSIERSHNFWAGENGADRENPFWSIFHSFARQMDKMNQAKVPEMISELNDPWASASNFQL